MAKYSYTDYLSSNTYPGRGIIIGKTEDGTKAVIAYFIMGRSENSRNRIFERFDGGMRTKAYDESKVVDPSLIIYNPYLAIDNYDIITNGDQTDTIYDFIVADKEDTRAFENALSTRIFEPDRPNYTPRISGICKYDFENKSFRYKLGICKSANGRASACTRCIFDYTPEPGIGHFIHTYKCNAEPIPSFEGEPKEVFIPNSTREFADILWNNLNEDNKVSLFVRAIPLDGSEPEEIIINKNE